MIKSIQPIMLLARHIAGQHPCSVKDWTFFKELKCYK